MKIAVFSDNFYPELSGITDSLITSGRALAEHGHTILFVGPRYTKADYVKVHLPDREPDYGPNIKIIRLPAFPYKSSPTGQGRAALPLGATYQAVKNFGPDIIHTHSPFGAGLEALFISKRLGVPLVGTNHTPPSEFIAYSPITSSWVTRLVLWYFAWYYNRCQFVSAPCLSLLNEMKAHGFKGKSVVVPNAIALKSFQPLENSDKKLEYKKRFGFSPHTILYTGRLADEKHIDVIIKALAVVKNQIPDVILVITGHGSAEASLKKLTESLGLQTRVKFLGFVDNETFPHIYQASDLFVIMSTAESQSLSLMQAMASGLSVIGASARALPEYINETNGLLVAVGDEEALAKAIVQIFSDSNQAKQLGVGGVATVQKFLPDIMARIWEEIYTKAILKYHDQ